MTFKTHLLVAWAGIVLLAMTAAAQEKLTSLSAVMALPYPQAGENIPVEVEATVTYLDFRFGGGFIQDAEQGIYLRLPSLYRTNEMLHVGDRVHIDARTGVGDYTPVLSCESLTVTGTGPMPKPILVTPENLFQTQLDSQWVQVSGQITRLEMDGDKQLVFTFEMYGWPMKILVPGDKKTFPEAAQLVQRRVSLQGVAATVFNGRRQMTGRYFCVPSLKNIEVLGPDNAQKPAVLLQATHLLRSGTSPDDVVKVCGVVTHAIKTELWLRDASGSVRVQAAGAGRFTPGDRVEAEGVAAIAPFSPILLARQVSQIGQTNPPVPARLPDSPIWKTLLSLQMELVSTEALFLGSHETSDEILLQCRVGKKIFQAAVPKPCPFAAQLAPGSRVQITGICELTTTHLMARAGWVDGFTIHLRGADDLRLLSSPSWWTPQRLSIGLLGCVGLVVGTQIWIWQLRRQVLAQTRMIQAQVEQKSVLDERQRIARDLHDTLEQQMTGVGLQISCAEEQIASHPNEARAALRLARKMVRYCCDEADRTVRDLRGVLLEERGLGGALQEVLPSLVANSSAKLVFEVQGTPSNLDAVVENHLLNIAQESVANAVQHAAATRIKVMIDYAPNTLTLTIADDGRGFEASVHQGPGHFGLIGMRERANKMKAALAVESVPGKGTSIRVTLPIGDNR